MRRTLATAALLALATALGPQPLLAQIRTFTDATGKFDFVSATPTAAGSLPQNPPACDLDSNNATHTCWYVRASVDGVGVSIWSSLIDVYSSATSTIPADVNIASSRAGLFKFSSSKLVTNSVPGAICQRNEG